MTKTRGGRQKASALVDLADESKEWRAPLAPDTSSQPSTSTRSTRSTRSSNASSAATATVVGTTAHNSDNNTSFTNTTTSTTTTARKRSKKKKADETLRSDPDVIQALIEADYEANVDPYRGINPCFAISYNNGSQDGIDADIPWKKCDDTLSVDKLLSTKWKFISSSNNETIVNVEEGEDYEESTNGGEDSNNNVALLVQCDCPTVDKWARDGMETYNKQLNAKKKKRGKKRKKSGSENNNSSSSADEMKSGEDDDEDDDDSIMILLGNNNNDDNAKTVLKRGPHLICGERKKDSKNATLLHPCDYNPVCEYCFILYVCGHWIFLFGVLYAYPHF